MRTITLNNLPPAPPSAPAAASQPDYIDKRELARRTGRGERTINTWMAQGRIPYFKVGRTIMFKWSEVEAHLQTHFHVCPAPTNLTPAPKRERVKRRGA